MEKSIFIDADSIVIGLLKVSDKKELPLDLIINTCKFVAQKARSCGEFDSVTDDVNYDSIYRLCQYMSQDLEISYDTVYVICPDDRYAELLSRFRENDDCQEFILETIKEFADTQGF